MSYDVGVEKPDKRIFNAAELMLAHIISARNEKTMTEAKVEVENWQKVYVSDDYTKDVVGSANAGWSPVLFDPKDECASFSDLKLWRSSQTEESHGKTCKMEEYPTETLGGLFKEHDVATVHSLRDLVSWLTGEP
jgi:FMN phosphatase YigB (HAD superfamily)